MTDRAESVVSASAYGSVTTFVSTAPVEGTKTSTSKTYEAPAHDAGPRAHQMPSRSRSSSTRVSAVAPLGRTSRSTSFAVGAQTETVGRPAPSHVTPSRSSAAPP